MADYVPNDSNTDESSVASHSCTDGNSIEQDLLSHIRIEFDLGDYKLILSALIDLKKGKYNMPSFVVESGNHELFYADNPDWLIDTFLPELKEFTEWLGSKRLTEDGQRFLSCFEKAHEALNAITATIKILETAIEYKLLNREQTDAVCDASKSE